MKKRNLLTLTDSYKFSHAKQYPDGTQIVRSYFESRVGAKFEKTVFFGLQYLVKEYLAGVVVTKENIEEAEWLAKNHVGPNTFYRAGWEYILNKHEGRLPIEIRAVPEGFSVPEDNVLMTIENTDSNPGMTHWLTNFIETLLVQVWYPSTVASQSFEARNILLRHLNKSGTITNIDFMLNDFGVRGSTSMESAALGGLAHLISFKGTDNVPALIMARDYYGSGDEIVGFSVNASEHSTITSHGQSNELETYRRYFQDLYPSGIAACVADSWNVYEAARMWAGPLKEMLLERNGKAVFRPDSGDARLVDPTVIKILGRGFGLTKNKKGYYSLPMEKIGVIQGDGVDLNTIDEILTVMEDDHQLSSDNIIFGSGGALLQKLNRDTQRFAFKCSEIVVDGVARPVSKNPITDKTKRSKAGQLSLIKNKFGEFKTVPRVKNAERDILEVVFRNGHIFREQSFQDVRNIALND